MTREPPVSKATLVSTTHQGREISICLVVTHWSTEGAAILERLTANGESANFVEQLGQWRVQHYDDGPSRLYLEFPSQDEIPDAVIDRLQGELVKRGVAESFSSWGVYF